MQAVAGGDPMKYATRYSESDSSSDEEEVEMISAVEPLSGDETFEARPSSSPYHNMDNTTGNNVDFANFQSEFDTSYDEPVEEYVPPSFNMEQLQPQIEAEPQDLSPLENVPRHSTQNKIYLASETLSTNIKFCQPVSNPLTGNVICCQYNKEKVVLHEVHLTTGAVVACTELLDDQLCQKVTSLYGNSPIRVNRVIQLATGLHRSGQTRVRLCALVELEVWTQSGSTMPQISLIIWQWGYASSPTKPIGIQSLISPPNHANFTYQASSLQIGDGLVFLAGYAQRKGPCVFVARPAVKDTWAANFLGPSTSTISHIAVTKGFHRKYKLLAIAMQDGTLSVWTYEAAVARKGSKEDTKVILPLCRLENTIAQQPITSIADDRERRSKCSNHNDSDEAMHFCTYLEWKTPDSSYNSLLYLAAAFTNGLCIFHINLPILMDTSLPEAISQVSIESKARTFTRLLPKPRTSTQLAQTVKLYPFSAARWSLPSDWSSVSWVDLGPHCPPSLAIWLEEEDVSTSCVLGVIDLENNCKFTVLCDHDLAQNTGCLVNTSCRGSILCYSGDTIVSLTPSMTEDLSFFASMRLPLTAEPPGLDSAGYVLSSSPSSILHAYTVTQCNRKQRPDLNSIVPNFTRLDWGNPVQRHLLVRSNFGDTKKSQETIDYDVTGGSNISIVCELCLTLPGMMPHRIIPSIGSSSLCAVLFRPSLATNDRLALDPAHFCIYDMDTGKMLESREGRDVAFLPSSKAGEEKLLVLGADGTMIYMLRRKSVTISPSEENGDRSENTTKEFFEDGMPYRPLLGFDNDDTYIDCRRILIVSSAADIGLVVIAKRISDCKVCLVAGKCQGSIEEDKDVAQAIPHIQDACLWLHKSEEVLNLRELPQYEEGRHCLAVATQSRVILVNSTRLNIRAQVKFQLASSSLAPIGSHTVAFISCDNKLRYLCCLDGKFRKGIIATLPVPISGHAAYALMTVRPERFLYARYHAGIRLVEHNENENSFPIPTCITRPAMLLEPMVANALCEADNPGESTILLRAVIERFGRKVGSFPHGEDEGIGVNGTGLTQQVMKMLSAYKLHHPASWLLTGTVQFERTSHSKILPSWMPVSTKSVSSPDADSYLHVLSNGDLYFMDYVKSPDHNMASTLPLPSDPSSVFSRELALAAMKEGDIAGAMKMLDLSGTAESESTLLQMVLAMQADPFADVVPLLQLLSGDVKDGHTHKKCSTSSALATLTLHLRSRKQLGNSRSGISKSGETLSSQWMRQLAPSVQRNHGAQRVRHYLLGESAITKAVTSKLKKIEPDVKWNTRCNESKHIWNEGPFKERENLLLLERMEDWLGRRRPGVIGREGAQIALERGEKTLADILNRANEHDDDGSFGGTVETGVASSWINAIGEGRTDEENLSAYFRISEGADEDSAWKTEGLEDLTKHKNKVKIIGQDIIKLKESSSSVDVGEPGKVKPLYDIVFDEPNDDSPVGFYMEVPRGSSCDVGLLHGPIHDSRKRCTIEFWFHVPMAEEVAEEIILVRRCVCDSEEDLSTLCVAGHSEKSLWELALLPTGELEFRTSGGTILNSSDGGDDGDFGGKPSDMMGDFGEDDNGNSADMSTHGEISWQRWNHVCLIFSSKHHEDMIECSITMMMKGLRVASAVARIVPPGLEEEKFEDSTAVDGVLANSVILFGLNPVGNLRFTELRLWSCERNEDDVKMMMYEYLRAAENKKRFKVKIRNKKKADAENAKGGGSKFLAPPKFGKGLLSPPRDVNDSSHPQGLLLPPPRSRRDVEQEKEIVKEVDGIFENENLFDFIPPLGMNADKEIEITSSSLVPTKDSVDSSGFPAPFSTQVPMVATQSSEPTEQSRSAESLPVSVPTTGENLSSLRGGKEAIAKQSEAESNPDEIIEPLSIQEPVRKLPLLSRQVRSSAAAALVRGPPATRHFGGNRGGFDFSNTTRADGTESARVGVGSIAICGAEKTVVYKYDRLPPGKIYPIGASGAIISDEIDNSGSEYLCCFSAKDKRMVVFELTAKTVVVELQMTTKLNYWRYLPPQANSNALVFMLITPIGGFHWMPLSESPRPRQVWKRGPGLQGKKIVSYEEGGSNGKNGSDVRSTVALILVSQASSGTPLEAWLMLICGGSRAILVPNNLSGAGLFRPSRAPKAFFPFMVTANEMNEKEIVLNVHLLVNSQNLFAIGDVLTSTIIDQRKFRKIDLMPPTMAMGTMPEVIICCHEIIVIAIIRRKGLLLAYEFKGGSLTATRQEVLNHYVVDASVRPGGASPEGNERAEVVLLLAHGDSSRDGQIVSISIDYSIDKAKITM
mmetsp:Transcript_9082/g.13252  ORF Transcript_9082/g.13252 Transcript_9082/m.13252 type:complete len:2301 (+) Transcript_9082:206-7108(+)